MLGATIRSAELSGKTQLFLEKIKGDWPFDGTGEANGDFEPEHAEALARARLYDLDVDDLAADSTPFYENSEKQDIASTIQKELLRKQGSGESFRRIHLLGSIYQYCRKYGKVASIGQIAKFMNLSRITFSRRYKLRDFYEALLDATGEAKRELLDTSGLTVAQRTSREAKKRNVARLRDDLYSQD